MDEGKVAPGLLLAMPQLIDPNFAPSVVLMIEHTDDGSFGLVINRPSSMSVVTLLKALEVDWRGAGGAVVWGGGPVMPATGWVLHAPLSGPEAPIEQPGTITIAPGIALSTSPDMLKHIARRPPPRLRFLLGYSGWGPGQLTSEMARGSWLH